MENAPEIFWGFDELYLEGMQIGCKGMLGAAIILPHQSTIVSWMR